MAFIAINWWLYLRTRRTPRSGMSRRCGLRGQLPFVTVQLPIFNEQFVIDRLIDAVCKLDYPRDRFEIQVLDDRQMDERGSARSLNGMRAGLPGWSRSRLCICIAATAWV
jgi:cellulose synthase/poly-beta-1,6-N-acetylglucosamine synthase-like glycosyltransferase